MWRKNPIPRGAWAWSWYGASFEPVCEESDACKNARDGPASIGACKCSGDSIGDSSNLEIVDKVEIPVTLKPGKYVLGWRWDCEESTQIWASCSDVTIVSPSPTLADVLI